MNTSILYGMDPLPEVVFQAPLTIRKQEGRREGRYFLEPLVPQESSEPEVAKMVKQALDEVVSRLNGKTK
jgi:hypothetical protein